MQTKFKPTRCQWVIVANNDYSEKRKQHLYEGFSDIPQVVEDVQNIKKGIMRLGAMNGDIRILEDCSFEQMKKLIREIKQDLENLNSQGQKTLVFFYYAGHGMQDNYCFSMHNQQDARKYPLESQLRAISQVENSYIVALFDCCRERMSDAMRQDLAQRGSGAQDNPTTDAGDSGINLIISFGCKPSSGVPAKSTVAVNYFEHLRGMAETDGSVILPNALLNWQGTDKEAETVLKISQPLVLQIAGNVRSEASSDTAGEESKMDELRERLAIMERMAKLETEANQRSQGPAQAQAQAPEIQQCNVQPNAGAYTYVHNPNKLRGPVWGQLFAERCAFFTGKKHKIAAKLAIYEAHYQRFENDRAYQQETARWVEELFLQHVNKQGRIGANRYHAFEMAFRHLEAQKLGFPPVQNIPQTEAVLAHKAKYFDLINAYDTSYAGIMTEDILAVNLAVWRNS